MTALFPDPVPPSETVTRPAGRANYVVALEIVTLSPLSHGAGADGNVTRARTREYLVDVSDPDTLQTTPRLVRVPIVSGAALKSTLREHAFGHLAEALGLRDGDVSLDALRLLLKGGKNDSGGASVSLDEARRLRELFPLLAVFGSMDAGLPLRGEVRVSEVTPWCRELVDAGLLPRTVSAIEVAVDGRDLVAAPQVTVYPDRAPVPLHLVLTEEEYYRHDLRTSPHAPLLGDGQRAALEDKAAARKGKVADAAARREANESMPHSMEAIAPGVPLVATLRLLGATAMEWECLAWAITRWIRHGALLGGATGKGHGRCQVRVAGALCYAPPDGTVAAAPGTALSVDRAGELYVRHILDRAEELRAELGKSTRGAKKGKPTAMPEDAEAEAT